LSNGPPQIEDSLFSPYSLDETLSAAQPRPSAFTPSASGQTISYTSPCSRTTGRSCARPRSWSVTGTLPPPPSLFPRSLSNLGWKREPSYRIRHDPPTRAPFPFPYSPPGSPPHLRPGPLPPDHDIHLSSSPKGRRDGNTSPSDLTDLPTSTRADQDATPGLTPDPPSTAAYPKFLTIKAQKAGASSPSLVDIITMMDHHPPGFLFLTEITMHPHSGTLPNALRIQGYKTHHHPSNAPSLPDYLPEARLPNHITHPGGGCWLAYKKITSWSPLVSPLTLSQNCPSATTCAV